MSDRIYIRISYGQALEGAEAEHVGTDPDGSELYRVWRQGRVPGEAERVDVLRLRRQEGDRFDFIGAADHSRRGTAHLVIAATCLGQSPCTAFRDQLEEHGCVVESQLQFRNAIYLVISHPTDVPVHEWHAKMLRETIGVAPDALPEFLRRETRTKEQQRRRRQTRQSIRVKALSAVASVVGVARVLAMVVLVVGVLVGGVALLSAAAPPDRPRVATIGMLVALAPLLLSRQMWPVVAVCAAAGIASLSLLGGPTPSYGPAAALGALYALCLGAMAVLLGILSLFSSNTREMGRAVFLVILPALASALSGVAVALTSAAAAGRAGGMANGARVVAIVGTAVLLLAPAAALLSNAGAILGDKGWRANPKLQLGALATMPLAMLPVLLRVGVPIALLWAVAWLAGRLG
jgi:hypothetical protein